MKCATCEALEQEMRQVAISAACTTQRLASENLKLYGETLDLKARVKSLEQRLADNGLGSVFDGVADDDEGIGDLSTLKV